MAFYTATYKTDEFYKHKTCQLQWKNDDFRVYSWQGRLFLYTNDDFRIAELINGYEGLSKYHKGSFETWIENVKKKDLKKIETLEQYQFELENDIDLIKTIWKKIKN